MFHDMMLLAKINKKINNFTHFIKSVMVNPLWDDKCIYKYISLYPSTNINIKYRLNESCNI